MIRRSDYTASDALGTPEPGVYITVRDSDGDLAAIYDDDGIALPNPFQSGTGGVFVYNVTAPGTYTEEYRLSLAETARTTKTILLIAESAQVITASGGDLTDAAPSVMATLANAKLGAITGYQYGNNGGVIAWPKGAPAYRISSTIDIDITVQIEGDGGGFPPGMWATIIHPDANLTAFRIQSWNTEGATGTNAGDLFTGAGSLLMGFGVVGRYNGTTVFEGEYHAFHVRGTCSIRDSGAFSIQGDAINIHAGVGLPELGAANCWEVSNFWAQDCRNGLKCDASDTNAAITTRFMVSGARQWGIWHNSGASNTYVGCLAQLCGVAGEGTTGKPAAACHYSGHHYYVIVGQESWCSTNAPTGTTSSNTGWGWMETGVEAIPGFKTWFNGMVCRAGGPARFQTGALVLGMYYEGSQPPVQNGGDALMLGGSWGGLGRPVGGAYITGQGNQVVLNAVLVERGGVVIADDVSGTFLLGRSSPGNPAVLRAAAASTHLALCGPDASQNVNVYSDQVHILQYSGGGCYATTSVFAPLVDNHNSLGASGKRWTELWAASATIQTSDRNQKTRIRKLGAKSFSKLLDAVGAVPLVAFKFKDAVKVKGKKARDHYGIIAQDLHDEMVKLGLDPFVGGVLGFDVAMEEVEEEVEVDRDAMRTEVRYEDQIEVVDGKAIQRNIRIEAQVPDFDEIPVYGETGEPIIIPARSPQKTQVILDGEVRDIEFPGAPERPMTHKVRKTERVKEKRTVRRPKIKNGEPEMIWNVRYDEFWALRQAWLEREMGRAA